MFQHLRMPLVKAFALIYRISISKTGVSCLALAREFNLDPRTVTSFRIKLQQAMVAEHSEDADSEVHHDPVFIDSINISQRGPKLNGFQTVRIKFSDQKNKRGNRIVKCHSCYYPNKNHLTFSELERGKYTRSGPMIEMWNFKTWLTGIHHHCSLSRIKGYMDEFCFRLNNNQRIHSLWKVLIKLMMQLEPHAGKGFENNLYNRTAFKTKRG